MRYFDHACDWFSCSGKETWNWFNSLHQDEWMALLAVVAGLGFLCMRGLSGRGNI